jgi:ArsR family transcriptional regulator, arsenate/arsenite/antimonite-responsive transcriptional repressor
MRMNTFTLDNLPLDRETTTRLLVALGDPVRIEICLLLGMGGRLNVTDIAANFRVTRPAISHHLKVLREAGALRSEKIGQEVFYWLNYPSLESCLGSLLDVLRRCPRREG